MLGLKLIHISKRGAHSLHRRSKVSVQISKAGQHDESRHNFEVVYIHQLGHHASLLSVLLLNWFQIFVYIFVCSNVMYIS